MRNKIIISTIAAFFIGNNLMAQLNESFSDMNFTENPAWTGNTDKFLVQAPITSGDGSIDASWNPDGHMLQSIPDGGDAVIVTESSRAYGEWLFSIADGKSWSISSSNDFAVIIMSDTNDPDLLKDGAQNFNGYYFGYDKTTADKFALYKQVGTTSTAIITTTFPSGIDGTASIPYSIKITRQNNGDWSLYIDEGLYNDPVTLQGTVNDNEITTSNYFAFATNIGNPSAARVAYIDNIITRNIYTDTYAPIVTQITFANNNSISLKLNEYTESTSTENTSNYTLENIGNPQSAAHISGTQDKIGLQFSYEFSANEALSLTISGVEDFMGNAMDTTINFTTPPTLNVNITESFTDENLTESPTWTGETGNFSIMEPETSGDGAFPTGYETDGAVLRSNSNTESSVMVFETYRAYGQWNFSIADGAGWSISSTNDFQIILISDTNEPSNLKTGSLNFNGYFLRFDGSQGDAFILHKQTGTTSTPIITTDIPMGTDGSTPTAFVVKVTRTQTDGWKLYIDEGWDSEAYSLRGISTDNEIETGIYFGISTNINTPSETRVAYFDNIYIGEIEYDTTPPAITQLKIKNENTLKLTITEPLNTTLIENGNFSVASGNSISQIDQSNYGMNITLQFSENFTLLKTDTLNISGLADIEENTMRDTSIAFTYITAVEGDIVINEIFFDNNPVIGLPEYDYLELYNNSGYDINIENWTLTINESERTFPSITINANDYLIITSSAALSEYESFGPTISLISTTMLTNSGVPIVLKDTLGQIIHSVEYTDDWYHESNKEDGGWSIEQIDPNAICAMENNWRASIAEIGGTPGTINSVDAENQDNTPPSVVNASILSANSIALLFSEAIPPTEINSAHVAIFPSLGSVMFEQNSENKKLWTITTTAEIPNRVAINITLTNISDYCGNILTDTAINVWKVAPQFQQVIINEIMADPSPEEGIRYEYVELYNCDTLPVNLQDWKFWAGSRNWTIPSITIEPSEYLLILPEYMAAHPNAPEKAIYFFDEADLTDGGTMLQLTDPNDNVITWVDYDDTWQTNTLHTLGGYALERIDTDYLCGSAENWETSIAENHGTPGSANSIAGTTMDTENPQAIYYILPQDTSIQIEFNSPMWPDTSLRNIEINSVTATQAWVDHPYGNILTIKFVEPLETNNTYTLAITNFLDCNENPMENTTFTFEKPQSPEENDLVINEVLFNPRTGCNDFVELYNISNKYINLDELYMATINDYDLPENIKQATNKRYILPPNSYYVLTSEYECLEENYSPVNRNQTILTSLPSMADSEGSIMILDKQGNTIDLLKYTEKMHNSLLSDADGVSLERISPLSTSDNISNWFSAAADAGFATPTRQNSNYNNTNITENNISLLSETFSPDSDGFEDFLQINYKFSKGNNILNIRILDHNGLLVRDLVNNESVSVEGFVIWDGTDNDLHKLPVGVYIIYSEWYDESGNQKSSTKTCVLAGELK